MLRGCVSYGDRGWWCRQAQRPACYADCLVSLGTGPASAAVNARAWGFGSSPNRSDLHYPELVMPSCPPDKSCSALRLLCS